MRRARLICSSTRRSLISNKFTYIRKSKWHGAAKWRAKTEEFAKFGESRIPSLPLEVPRYKKYGIQKAPQENNLALRHLLRIHM
eukprot:scaffold13527_cov72-Skeletonema_dohrnii-CCMP3373.AAC.2